MEYCIAREDEMDEVASFITNVFHVDFLNIMKKVYTKGQKLTTKHHLIKENGKIVAAVGVYEQDVHIGEEILKTGFIGSVSVDESCRGKGYMKLLMKKAEEDMRSDGIAVALLSGKRNRYGFFGYERGGQGYEFSFEEENVRLTIGWEDNKKVELVEVNEDSSLLDDMYSLYKRNRMWTRNREDFYIRSLTWDNVPYAVLINDEFAGYMLIGENKNKVTEIECKDWNDILIFIRAVFKMNEGKGFNVLAHVWEKEKSLALQKCCEFYKSMTSDSFLILDYEKALRAFLLLKGSYKKLEEGSFCLNVKGEGAFLLTVKENDVAITKISNTDEADITLEPLEVINALLSPAASLYEDRSINGYPKNWFPLEFSIPSVDQF